MEKLYAQIDETGLCFCIGTPETDLQVDSYEYLGKRYVDGMWEEIPSEPTPHEPSNIEVAQMISDLQADLIIAGVI